MKIIPVEILDKLIQEGKDVLFNKFSKDINNLYYICEFDTVGADLDSHQSEIDIKKFIPNINFDFDEFQSFNWVESIFNEIASYKTITDPFSSSYFIWFKKAEKFLTIFFPENKKEFNELYYTPTTRKNITKYNYTIQDYFLNIKVTSFIDWLWQASFDLSDTALSKINQQISILESCKGIIDLKINEIKQNLSNEVYMEELDSAIFLFKNQFYSSAGTIGGILLEKYLINLIKDQNDEDLHPYKMKKDKPTQELLTIGDLSGRLKNKNIISDTDHSKFIRFWQIRNKCAHHKEEVDIPTKEEIKELLDFIKWINE